ncbi:Pentatricopeptide repeat [Macleaya cordata]|uniref:Pentatricopeptide repeat n=1 Tax=Macleaya cordata TaxID=56857 RepID=A0A200PWP4_MACCD|nr:Pentatricopeptide repeat [Macleaya cordata]
MNSMFLFGRRIGQSISNYQYISRLICDGSFKVNGSENGCEINEELKKSSEKSDFGFAFDESHFVDETLFGVSSNNGSEENDTQEYYSPRRRYFLGFVSETDRIFKILQQDGPGFDAKFVLDDLQLRVSSNLVREVLLRLLKNINLTNKLRCAKLAYKFFRWSGQQKNYRHTSNTYHLTMKIFAECEHFTDMWRLVDEMTDRGFPTTARTFNILICTCGEVGITRRVVERFIKSKTFNYRPFKHSFNAILHSLLVIHQYSLIEWVYQQMQLEDHSPDILTYNILLCAKYRLGKLDHFHRLITEMAENGLSPDLHTYNIILHVLGEGGNSVGALNLLNHMREEGCDPSLIHFTSLIDGLSRAGNLDACEYFFNLMIKKGFLPDVVCYTVMITGYIVAGELEKAQALFDEMIIKGQLPNVFTYNSMIRGLCIAGKFEEACSMLKEMESRGCNPNFVVYSTLVGNLRNAGKHPEANEIVEQMEEKGHYATRLKKLKWYRRC